MEVHPSDSEPLQVSPERHAEPLKSHSPMPMQNIKCTPIDTDPQSSLIAAIICLCSGVYDVDVLLTERVIHVGGYSGKKKKAKLK